MQFSGIILRIILDVTQNPVVMIELTEGPDDGPEYASKTPRYQKLRPGNQEGQRE